MKKLITIITLFTVLSLSLLGCGTSSANSTSSNETIDLTISAAASLQFPMDEIAENFQADNPNIKVSINYASSGSLRKQIEQGAPADLFFSANIKHFDELIPQNLVDEDSRTEFAHNKICLIFDNKLKETIKTIEDINNQAINKISIGTPETVPAGNYAKQSLEFYNLFDKVEDKIVYGKSVKDVVAYVESGNVDVGMVYFSDTTTMKENITYIDVDDSSHKAIQYVCGIVSSSKQKDASKKFIEYVQSQKGKESLNKYGFITED